MLSQLTPANVGQLQVAWVYHMKPAAAAGATPAPADAPVPPQGRGGRGSASGFSSGETTPLVINGVMYISTPYGRVVALDATSGAEIWTYAQSASTRGVEYWPGDGAHAAACPDGPTGAAPPVPPHGGGQPHLTCIRSERVLPHISKAFAQVSLGKPQQQHEQRRAR